MSLLYEVMIVANDEYAAVAAVNRALREADPVRKQQLLEIDMERAGGSKFWTIPVYAACFNHLPPAEVDRAVAQAPWQRPERAVYVRDCSEYGPAEGLSTLTVAQLRDQLPEATDA